MKKNYSIYNQAGDGCFELPEEVVNEYPNMGTDKVLEVIKARALKEAMDAGVNIDLDKEVESFILPVEQQAEILGVSLPQALIGSPRIPH